MDFSDGAKLREHRYSEAIGDATSRPEVEELSGETDPRAVWWAISPVCSLKPAVSLIAAQQPWLEM